MAITSHAPLLIDSQEQIVADSRFCIIADIRGAKPLLKVWLTVLILKGWLTIAAVPSVSAQKPSPIDFENKLAIALLRQHHARPQRRIL